MYKVTVDIIGDKQAPTIDPEDLIGFTYVNTHDDVPQKATVTNWTDEGKFIIKFVNGGEELKDYNDLINCYNQQEERNVYF